MTNKIYYGEDHIRKEATGEKLEEILSAQAEAKSKLEEAKKLEDAKEAARARAIDKLEQLGLTAEEIAALRA
jgi:hypothetical protein